MRFSPDILVLRGLADTLLIGPRAAFGEGARHALDSDEEIRRRLKQMLSDPGDAALLRSFWMRWRIGGDGIAYANNRMLVDRVAAAARCGRLAVLVAPNADLKYVERPDPQRAHQKLAGFTPRAALAPGAASSRTGRPAPVHHPGRFVAMATQRLAPVSVGRTAASPGLAQALRVDAMSLEERIAEVLHRTLPRLPADMRGEFEALLDPAAIGMTVAVLAVWAGSHVFGVGFVVDAVLLGAGLFFMGQAIMEAVETIRLFLARVLHAKTEDDLDAAAALLALAIAAIGVRTFVNAITRGAGRVAGGGKTRGKLPRRDHAPAKPSPKPQPKPPAEKPPPASKETSIGSGEPGIGLRPAEKPKPPANSNAAQAPPARDKALNGAGKTAGPQVSKADSSEGAATKGGSPPPKTYDRPPAGSMTNEEARQWYHTHEDLIPQIIDKSADLETQAKQAHAFRNEIRTAARDAMTDRATAEHLHRTRPNKSWEQIVSEKRAQGLDGDELWRSIIESSQKSNPEVDARLGIKRQK